MLHFLVIRDALIWNFADNPLTDCCIENYLPIPILMLAFKVYTFMLDDAF